MWYITCVACKKRHISNPSSHLIFHCSIVDVTLDSADINRKKNVFNSRPVTSSSISSLHYINASIHACHFKAPNDKVTESGIFWDYELELDQRNITLSDIDDVINTAEDKPDLGIRLNVQPPASIEGRRCDGMVEVRCFNSIPGDDGLCSEAINVREKFFQIVCGGSAMLRITTETTSLEPFITSLATVRNAAGPPDDVKTTQEQRCKVRKIMPEKRTNTFNSPITIANDRTLSISAFSPFSKGTYCREGLNPVGNYCKLALSCNDGHLFNGEACVAPFQFTFQLIDGRADLNDLHLIGDIISENLVNVKDWQINRTEYVYSDESDAFLKTNETSVIYQYDLEYSNFSQILGHYDFFISSVIVDIVRCQVNDISPTLKASACFISRNNRSVFKRFFCERLTYSDFTGNQTQRVCSMGDRNSVVSSELIYLVIILQLVQIACNES